MSKLYSVVLCEVSRNYGGPEEGGWWYDITCPVDPDQAIEMGVNPKFLTYLEEAKKYRDSFEDKLKELNEGRYSLNSVLSDFIYHVSIQDGYPHVDPPQRPYYE